jgi:hypothetical protein
LTTHDRPDPAVLSDLDETRSHGRRLLPVTGRTLEHLLAGFAAVGDSSNAVVAEKRCIARRAFRQPDTLTAWLTCNCQETNAVRRMRVFHSWARRLRV